MGVILELLILLLLLVAVVQRQLPISAINKLRQEILKAMSDLSDATAAIANDVTELQAASQRVIGLLTQPNPDVDAAVAALRAADAGFDAIRDGLNGVGAAVPTEPPPTES